MRLCRMSLMQMSSDISIRRCSTNGYMAYVQRQRAGSKEYGDKTIREDTVEYLVNDEDKAFDTGNEND